MILSSFRTLSVTFYVKHNSSSRLSQKNHLPINSEVTKYNDTQRENKADKYQQRVVSHSSLCFWHPIGTTTDPRSSWDELVPAQQRGKHGDYSVQPGEGDHCYHFCSGNFCRAVETLKGGVHHNAHHCQVSNGCDPYCSVDEAGPHTRAMNQLKPRGKVCGNNHWIAKHDDDDVSDR